MTAADPSALAAVVLGELLEQISADADELGLDSMPLTTWAAVLSDSSGGVAREILTAAQLGSLGALRTKAVRLAVDAVTLLVQLDGDGGRVAETPDETRAPAATSVRATHTPDALQSDGGTPQTPMLRAVSGAGGDDEAWWTGDRWRDHLRRHGVRVADALRQAQAFARELGQQEPAVLDAIVHADVASRLRSWVENRGSAAIA